MLEEVLLDLRIGVGLLEPALHLLYVCCYRQTILGHVSLDMRSPVQWENAHLLVDFFKEAIEIGRGNQVPVLFCINYDLLTILPEIDCRNSLMLEISLHDRLGS